MNIIFEAIISIGKIPLIISQEIILTAKIITNKYNKSFNNSHNRINHDTYNKNDFPNTFILKHFKRIRPIAATFQNNLIHKTNLIALLIWRYTIATFFQIDLRIILNLFSQINHKKNYFWNISNIDTSLSNSIIHFNFFQKNYCYYS